MVPSICICAIFNYCIKEPASRLHRRQRQIPSILSLVLNNFTSKALFMFVQTWARFFFLFYNSTNKSSLTHMHINVSRDV